jgi:predicted porin
MTSHTASYAAMALICASCLSGNIAKAADLGGDCCSDLEERVADLEATTVRKSNKKVSVTLYGQENKAALFWDDGSERNTYTVDNNYESSRFGVKGAAKLGGDWSAGYRLEVEFTGANSTRLNQFNDDNANDPLGPLNVRWSHIFVNNKKWGEVRLGLTGTPIYNITKDTNVTELEDTMHSDNRMNMSFLLRPKGFDGAEGLSKIRWSDISRCYESANAFVCSTRKNGVAYWSPNWQGFSASVGWFEDDEWGGALRYQKEWGETFEVGAGIGYANIRDERLQTAGGGLAGFERDFNEWAGSASIKHISTGLFLFNAFSFSDTDDSNAIGAFNHKRPPTMNAWDVEFGIQRKMPKLGLDKFGETSLWGSISQINDGFAQGSSGVSGTSVVFDNDPTTKLGAVPANGLISSTLFPTGVLAPGNYQVVGSEVNRWAVALDQEFEKSGMHLYWVYQHFDSPKLDLINDRLDHVAVPLDGFDLFYSGGRIYF